MVRQEVVETRVDKDLSAGLGCKSSTLSYLLHPGSRGPDTRAIAVTHIHAKPGIIRHDIQWPPGALVDVLERRSLHNMVSNEVDAMSEELRRTHSAPTKPGTSRSMRAFPEELDP